jgi:hypothetical protein
MKNKSFLFGIVTATAVAVACGEKAATPVSPSPAVSSDTAAAGADGSTLKATAPAPQQPVNGSSSASVAPNLVIANSTMKYLGDVSLTASIRYKVDVETQAGVQVYAGWATPFPGTDLSAHKVAEGVLVANTTYRWRARAEIGSSSGPWSAYWTFTTPAVIGPAVDFARTIGIVEATSIIRTIYSELRYNLGSSSTREERNVYLQRAVAALHFGHVRFNPQGRDSDWCIKNGGPGRPQSDDVIVRCDSRDAWDLVSGIGGNSYGWHTDYIGRLSSEQAVYPPPRSALDALPY